MEVHSLNVELGQEVGPGPRRSLQPEVSLAIASKTTHPCAHNAGAGMTVQDFCSSPGDLPAPELFLNVISAQEGELVLAHCSMGGEFPATQIIFCKDGMEVYSLKAVRGQLSYSIALKASQESTGRYTCGYQHKDGSNRVRSSSLSAPRDLAVAAPTTGIALGVVAASLLLLLPPATYFTVKKFACKERNQRQQDVPSHAEDTTDYGQMHYSTIAHFGGGRVSLGMPLGLHQGMRARGRACAGQGWSRFQGVSRSELTQ
ncbi:uncharacterized protein LOC135324104 isoform X3 [Dromaius novaehollandiae]|uniref:uncharacterized protein LOC135324104 isoform X3 n=1 Tax=Dromaius novaehollandiae TaxID=8790 RepID=UPI00311E2E84